jgi:hypothetical protein
VLHTRSYLSVAHRAWCLTAINWSRRIEDTAARLLEVSEKAREQRTRRITGYALQTTRSAARKHERNIAMYGGRPPLTPRPWALVRVIPGTPAALKHLQSRPPSAIYHAMRLS